MIRELFFESSHNKGFCGFKRLALKLDRLNVFFADMTVNSSVCARFLWGMRSAAQNKFLQYISDPSEKSQEFLNAIESSFLLNWEFFGAPSLGGVVADDFSFTFDLEKKCWGHAEGIEEFAALEIETQMMIGATAQASILDHSKRRAKQGQKESKILSVLSYPEAGIPPWRIEQLADAILQRMEGDPNLQIFVQSANPQLISLLCESGGRPFLGYKGEDDQDHHIQDLSLLDLSPASERGTRIGDLWATMTPHQIFRSFELIDVSEDCKEFDDSL